MKKYDFWGAPNTAELIPCGFDHPFHLSERRMNLDCSTKSNITNQSLDFSEFHPICNPAHQPRGVLLMDDTQLCMVILLEYGTL